MKTDASFRTARSNRRKILMALLFIAMQAVLLLVLLEVGGRLIDPLGISYYPSTAAYMDTMILEEPIGYRNGPGVVGRFYNHQITINALGLRHREIALGPDPARYRILFLGDSVVFGIGVADDQTLPVQLERILQERIGSVGGREIEVVNMGVMSYNTEQERIQYQQLGSRLGADLVLLRFTPNDIEPKMWIFSKRSNPIVAAAQRSYAVSLLFKIKQLVSRRLGGDPLIQKSSYVDGHPRWESIEMALSAIHMMTARTDTPFVVITGKSTGPETDLIRMTGTREGFPIIVADPFEDPRWSQLDPADHFAPGAGNHFDDRALGFTATIISEHLVAMGLIPPNRP